jgi:putative hemolysin
LIKNGDGEKVVKTAKITIASISTIALTMLMISTRVFPRRIIAQYIGMQTCIDCHGNDAIGNQYRVWTASPHAKAYQMLSSAASLAIAKKSGITHPTDNLACLRCHTTGGGKVAITKKEGVGCEACHGPGSRYYEFSNHASFSNRQCAYLKAIKLGMYPIIGIDGIKAREKLCRHCHTETRPCLPEDCEEQRRQKLPLQLIADFVFKHQLRR